MRTAENLIREIKLSEERRRKLAEIIRNSEILHSEFLEKGLIKKVESFNGDFVVAGIDSGLLQKSLHGIDLILIRAVGVVYYFKNGKLNDVKYYSPSSFFEPIIFQDPFSDIELDLATNVIRQKKKLAQLRK